MDPAAPDRLFVAKPELVLSPNLSSATAIPVVIPFDGKHSRAGASSA